MTQRPYSGDTTIDDVPSGDRLVAECCSCGWTVIPAWRTLPKRQQFTPLRDLRRKLVCTHCGTRGPNLVIEGMIDRSSQLQEYWRWPPNSKKPSPK